MITYHSITLSIFILFFSVPLCAQNAELPAENIAFHHITIKDGLANNRVDCMLQDHEGYLWFGTKRGLCRYNGYEFKIFKSRPGDTLSLRYHQISSLFEDINHTLWIGTTGGGLHYYNRSDNTFHYVGLLPRSNDEVEVPNVYDITIFSGDEILVTHLRGITRININTKKAVSFKDINSPDDLPGDVSSFFRDKSGIFFIAVQNDQLLYCYDTTDDRIIPYPWHSEGNISPAVIHQFFPFDNDNLWLATDKGLFNLNKKEKKVEWIRSKNAPGRNASLNFILRDYHKNLWMGGEGLFLYNKGGHRFYHFKNDPVDPTSFVGNIITCGLLDDQKNLWFGTFSRGVNVYYYNNKHFNPDRTLTDLIENLSKNITAIYKSRSGLLYLGTWDKGLIIIDNNNHLVDIERMFPGLGFLKSKIIRTIKGEVNGDIWIGTNDGLLITFNPTGKMVTRYKTNPDINNSAITTILFSGRDTVWIGTNDGILVFDRKSNTFTEKKYDNTSIPNVLDMVGDSSGNIWVASYATGLFRILHNGKVTKFETEGKLNYHIPGNKIVTLFRDKRNRMWVGTEFNGLYLYLPEKDIFQHFTVQEGLPSNDICSIQEDDKGRLWIGTNHGLCRFNYNLHDFKNYYWSDGMNVDEFHYNSNFVDPDNNIQYFGGTSGIVVFDPDEIQDSYITYPVKIEDISVNNSTVGKDTKGTSILEALRTGKNIKLKYNQNTISFRYTALNYSLAKKSNYAYMLQGLDDKYHYVKEQRQVTYTKLPSGHYIFKVIASNNDNIWDKKGAEFTFIINKPPWATWWAFLIYVALILLIIYALISQIRHTEKMKHAIEIERIEKEKQKELTQMKLRFFTNISHEFKTPLTLIIGYIEQMISEQHGNSKIKQKLSQVHENSHRLLKLINQLIDFRKMEQDVLPLNKTKNDLVHTVRKTMNLFNELAVKQEIRYSLVTDHKQLILNYDVDKIEKVLNNILSNAFKHTGKGGSISIGIDLDDKKKNVLLTLSDTGSGMTKEKVKKIFNRFNTDAENTGDDLEIRGSGIGLAYSKKLIELQGGNLYLDSIVSEGTTVTITLPYDIGPVPKGKTDREQPFVIETERTIPSSHADKKEHAKLPDEAPRILIVDDNDELRDYVRSILKDYYRIEEAKDGQAGLEMAMNNDYDLIVSDVMMPKLNGTEMCKKIKSNIKTSHIMVLLLTAKDDVDSVTEGYKYGADSYIAKPFVPGQLTTAISNLLKTRQHIKEYFTALDQEGIESIGILTQDKVLIDNATKIITDNLDNEDFSVENLGKELGLSRTHLYRKIKSLTGLSPNEYIRQVRLKKAAQLLRTGSLNISEVAYETGWQSPANFSTAFKSVFGISPKEYKAKMKK